jgi:hypothetical protein
MREIDDLLMLDHHAFWNERLRLLRRQAVKEQVKALRISHKWMLPSPSNALWDDTWEALNCSGLKMISAIKPKKCRLPLLGEAASGLF